jgi:hypothetical protein
MAECARGPKCDTAGGWCRVVRRILHALRVKLCDSSFRFFRHEVVGCPYDFGFFLQILLGCALVGLAGLRRKLGC